MSNETFELIYDFSDCKTEIIKHEESGLFLKLIQNIRMKKLYPKDEVVVMVRYFGHGPTSSAVHDYNVAKHFKVMYTHGDKRHLWDKNLLRDAVIWYGYEHLEKSVDHLQICQRGQVRSWESE